MSREVSLGDEVYTGGVYGQLGLGPARGARGPRRFEDARAKVMIAIPGLEAAPPARARGARSREDVLAALDAVPARALAAGAAGVELPDRPTRAAARSARSFDMAVRSGIIKAGGAAEVADDWAAAFARLPGRARGVSPLVAAALALWLDDYISEGADGISDPERLNDLFSEPDAIENALGLLSETGLPMETDASRAANLLRFIVLANLFVGANGGGYPSGGEL